jgi:PmbA protein
MTSAASDAADRQAPPAPIPLDAVLGRLGAALAGSVADAAELVWVETLSGRAVAGGRRGAREAHAPRRRLTVQVRAQEGERVGFQRSGSGGAGDLAAALRTAVAQSRLAPSGRPLRLAAPGGGDAVSIANVASTVDLHDPEVARLSVAAAGDLLGMGLGEGDRLVLDWAEIRLAVVNSRGLARAAEATAVTLAASHGRAPGIGRAAASARTLAALAAPALVARARRRATPEGSAEQPPASPVPVVLAAEAAAALVAFLAGAALSARSFLDATSPFAGRLGEPVADPALTLVDDGGDPAGLPFPWDLAGFAKERVVMIDAGVARTPAIDDDLSALLRRPPTAHATGLDDARPQNLFLVAGAAGLDDLAAAADGGLWIGELWELHAPLPGSGRLRAVARNVRRLTAGAPAAPLPDLAWEADLGELLRGPLAVGDDPVALAVPGGLGATSAPSLALPAVSTVQPLG